MARTLNCSEVDSLLSASTHVKPAPGLEGSAAAARPRSAPAPRSLLLLGAFLLLTLGAFAASVGAGWIDADTVRRLVEHPGLGAFATYVVVVFGMQMLWCPRMWGLIAAGVVFGPWLGIAVAYVPDALSALLCFGLARGASRDWAHERLRRHPRAQRLLALLARRRGGMTIFLLRVLPIHYTAVSYAAGIAGVRTRPYFVGTLAGALPGTVLYCVLGDAARRPAGPAFVLAAGAVVVVSLVGALAGRRLWAAEQARSAEPARDCASHPGGAEGS